MSNDEIKTTNTAMPFQTVDLIGTGVYVYMAPEPYYQLKPTWPGQDIPVVIPQNPAVVPQITFETFKSNPSEELKIADGLQTLKDLGMNGILALKLLAICDWNKEIAINIYKECKDFNLLGLAKEIMSLSRHG